MYCNFRTSESLYIYIFPYPYIIIFFPLNLLNLKCKRNIVHRARYVLIRSMKFDRFKNLKKIKIRMKTSVNKKWNYKIKIWIKSFWFILNILLIYSAGPYTFKLNWIYKIKKITSLKKPKYVCFLRFFFSF